MQQLVAPIALYPDELVAQVLAAATYPTEIVEANRWLQQNSSLKDAQLADAVDKQPWDPSVKALTQFPSVLANMDKNLSWTSALGDAYFNQPQDVLNAVQVMRKRAQSAGTLKTTAQQTVTTKDQTIIIEPANPEVVYLPEYDPWVVYGSPLLAYPGYFDAGFFVGPVIWFDVGFPLGHFHRHFPWGWHSWGCDWHNRFIVFNHNRFISRSPTFINRGFGVHGPDFRGAPGHGFPDRGVGFRGGPIDHRADRGFAAPHIAASQRPGAFSGFDHGGVANQMPPAASPVSAAVCMAAASPAERTAVSAAPCTAEAPAVDRRAVSAAVTAASVAAVCMAEEAEVTGKRICVRGDLYSKKMEWRRAGSWV